MPLHIKEKGAIRGTVTVRSHPAGAIEKFMVSILTLNEIESMGVAKAHFGEEFSVFHWVDQNIRDEKRKKRIRDFIRGGKLETRQRNIIVYSLNHGYDLLVQFLLSGYTGSFGFSGISWGEIGTGQTTPSNLDTALTTPTNRATVSYGADSGFNEAQIQFFFPDNVLANETYYEFGTFCGGTSTIGSGNLFNHALFSNPYSKSAGVDTTVEVDISFAAQNAAQFDQSVFS